MPIIDLGPSERDLPLWHQGSKWEHLLAVMLYPLSAERRLEYIVQQRSIGAGRWEAYFAQREAGGEDVSESRGVLEAGTMEALRPLGGIRALAAASSDEQERQKAEARGRTAGSMLAFMLAERTGIRHAKHMIEKLYAEDSGEGRAVGRSEFWIREAWREYRVVSHLWAVQWMAEALGEIETLTLAEFLGWAESVHDLALERGIEGITREAAWRAAPDLKLPEMKARILPIPDAVRAIGADYDNTIFKLRPKS